MSNAVGSDYFRTLRIPRRRPAGSSKTGTTRPAAPVAVVNDTLAQRFWGGAANAIGKRIRVGDGDWRTVIGVAADVKYARINEAPRPYLYLPFLQSYRSNMILHTRGAGAGRSCWSTRRARVWRRSTRDLPILHAQADGRRRCAAR